MPEGSAHAGGLSAAMGPLDVVIAPMRRRHLRSIVRIQAEHPHKGWSVGLWVAELRREVDRSYAVALAGRQVVGYAGLLYQDEDAHLTTIGVAEAWQRHAVATRLLLALLPIARARGVQNLTLEVRASNEPAIALYRRFGLAPAGVRKRYYADLDEDALIMWAHEVDTVDYGDRLQSIASDLDRRGVGATTVDPQLAVPETGSNDV